MAQPGEVVPELPNLLHRPEQFSAQKTTAVLRGTARHSQAEEEVRECGHVHSNGGGQR